MTQTCRTFLTTAAAAAGSITVVPFAAHAGGHSPHEFKTSQGLLTVHPVNHASIVMETPIGTLYVDPVGDAALYADFPGADLILVTHEHGDHYNEETLTALKGEATQMIVNPAVMAKLSDGLKTNTTELGNGATASLTGLQVDAIPAYNTTEERLNFHPEGRDNGYVLTMTDFRVYISGDTEDIPEMRALENIDLAFVCMNLPFTMEAAADAVREFAPVAVCPYHYRGRGGGTQDPEEFASLVGDAATVKIGNRY